MKKSNGVIEVHIGFDGYNRTISTRSVQKKWKNKHQANAMIARSVESGTSWMKKHPFIAPAVRKSQDKAIEAMQTEYENELKKTGF